MNSNIKDYLNNLMMRIPGGVEYLRDYRDERKWISLDSRMSIPGQKGNLTEIEIKPFMLAKYQVSKSLYEVIFHKVQDNVDVNSTPIVNISLNSLKYILVLLLKRI